MIHMLSRYLYEINRNRIYYQDVLNQRRVYLWTIAAFTLIAIVVLAWILRQ